MDLYHHSLGRWSADLLIYRRICDLIWIAKAITVIVWKYANRPAALSSIGLAIIINLITPVAL